MPRSHVWLGARAVPVFQVAGLSGLVAALVLQVALGGRVGLRPGPVLGLAVVVVGASLVWQLARRTWTGAESAAVLEHVLLATAIVAAAPWALALPARAHLDVLLTGMCLGPAVGRLGCLAVGCCYGVRSSWGIRYPPAHAAGGSRRVPVQLIEAAVWLGLAIAGAWVLGPPGAAASVVLCGYGVIRFGLESLRDDPRRAWLGVSAPRWLALCCLGAGVAASPPADAAEGALALAGLAVASGLLVTRGRWLTSRPALPAGLTESARRLGERLRAGSSTEDVQTWAEGGLAVAASRVRSDVLLITISRADVELVDAEAAILFDALGVDAGPPRPTGTAGVWAACAAVVGIPRASVADEARRSYLTRGG